MKNNGAPKIHFHQVSGACHGTESLVTSTTPLTTLSETSFICVQTTSNFAASCINDTVTFHDIPESDNPRAACSRNSACLIFCNTQFVPLHHPSQATSLMNISLSVLVNHHIASMFLLTSLTFTAKSPAVGVWPGRNQVASVHAQ
ncbi:hypothetical protein IKO50_02405 [bacterium]|nr:hypothetical protein [bacterium]